MSDKLTIKIVSGTRKNGKLIAMQVVVIQDLPKMGRVSTTRHLRLSGPDWMGVILNPIPSKGPEFTQYDVKNAIAASPWK